MNDVLRKLFWSGVVGCLVTEAAAAPTISSFTPTFGSSSDLTPITVYGNGFYPGALVVKFNGVAAVNPNPNAAGTQLTAYVPAGAPLGTAGIFVSVNGVQTTSIDQFTVIGPGPYVTGFAPDKGGAGTTVTVQGVHFTYPLTTYFDKKPVVVSGPGNSAVQFSVNAPVGVTTGYLTVSNNVGTNITQNYFYAPLVITNFMPTNGRAGTVVTLSGTNFLGASEVKFGNINASSFLVLSNNALQATAPPNVTTAVLRVTVPQGVVFTTNLFRTLPTISSFSPNAGTQLVTSVIITGTNLNEGSGPGGAPSVFFNGVASPSVTNVSFNQVTALVPNGATTGTISVTTTNGSDTNAALFYLPPKITSFTPATNPPGTRITITGTNFTGASVVAFNGVPSPNFTVTNKNLIGAEVPGGFNTGLITITAPAGTATSLTLYYAAPQITGMNQFFGLPGDIVRVLGFNFQGATAVRFTSPGGFLNGTLFTQTASYIDVQVPVGAITGPVSVVGPAGTAISGFNFTVNYSSLQLTVTDSPDPVGVGSNLTYTVQVQNLGPATTPAYVTNTLPASVSFSSASAGSTVGGVTTVSFGSLTPGQIGSFTVTGTPNISGVTLTNLTTAGNGVNPVSVSMNTLTTVLPKLLINDGPAGTFILSWPASLTNYTLQFSPSLVGVPWTNAPGPFTTNAGVVSTAVINVGGARFYRLQP